MSDPPLLKSSERLISYRYLNRAVKGATQARREGVRRVRASPPPGPPSSIYWRLAIQKKASYYNS